ncbi:MAG: protein kinase domain-containing protein [Isosphaeraceae bacterium]
MAETRNTSIDLLFGIAAVETRLIDDQELIEALKDRSSATGRSLAEILFDRGSLDRNQVDLVTRLVAEHLKRGAGDPEKSLRTITRVESTLEQIAPLDDPEVDGALARQGLLPLVERRRQAGAGLQSGGAYGASWIDDRFLIVRLHARGGLGQVFVAVDRDLGREVALKQIRPAFADNEGSRARFVREAEVTGGLEHPGIVPVYALGFDGDGRPYYAMRFVRGESFKEAIAEFHRDERFRQSPGKRSLALRKLLRRFLDVCNAVDYAHGRGVLHRDLKPSNIILGKHGETLVVDWGLAKAVGTSAGGSISEERPLVPPSASSSAETLPGSALGTPAYMSPEQASGAIDRLSIASDVYSLGATLYCLLTGRPPFEGCDVTALLAAVQNGAFVPPRQLDRSIPRALEAICCKAMSLTAGSRYGSARDLADEIERWMADEPVGARAEPLADRARRWMRRHRTTVIAALAAVLVALVGLGVVLAVESRAHQDLRAAHDREQARFDLAMAAIKAFHSGVSGDILLKEPQFQQLRTRLLGEARRFFARLEGLLKDHTDLRSRRALGQAYSELAEMTDKIGPKLEALELFHDELAIRRELAIGPQAEATDRAEVGRCLLDVGRIEFQTGNPEKAMTAYQEAGSALESLVAKTKVPPQVRALRATCYERMGELYFAIDRPAEAIYSYQKGGAIRAGLVREVPEVVENRGELAHCDQAIGTVYWAQGRPKEALEAFEEARSILGDLLANFPANIEFRKRLAYIENDMGYPLHSLGRTDEAFRSFEKARDILDSLLNDFPAVTEYRRQIASSEIGIGTLLLDVGRMEAALAAFEKARLLLEALDRAHPEVAEIRNALARCYSQSAHSLRALGKPVEALSLSSKAKTLREALVAANPTLSSYRSDLTVTTGFYGVLKQETGDNAAAVASFRKALSLLQGLAIQTPDDHYNRACMHARLASVAGKAGSDLTVAEGQAEADQAMADLRRAIEAGFGTRALLRLDHDLDALRSRRDFKLMMLDQAFPKDVFAPLDGK